MFKIGRNICYLLFLGGMFFLTSCLKDTYTENLNKEKSQIATYVLSQYPGQKPINSDGLYLISHSDTTVGERLSSVSDYAFVAHTW